MLPRNYARKSGVVVDVCLPHGVWFDATELEQIIIFVQSGGLDRAQADNCGLSQTPGMDATLKIPELKPDRRHTKADSSSGQFFDDHSSVLKTIAEILTWQID